MQESSVKVVSYDDSKRKERKMNRKKLMNGSLRMYPVTLAAVLAFVAIDAIADIQVPMWQYNRTKVYAPGAEAEVLNIINGGQDKCTFNQNEIPVFDFGDLKTLTSLRIAPGMTTDYWRFN